MWVIYILPCKITGKFQCEKSCPHSEGIFTEKYRGLKNDKNNYRCIRLYVVSGSWNSPNMQQVTGNVFKYIKTHTLTYSHIHIQWAIHVACIKWCCYDTKIMPSIQYPGNISVLLKRYYGKTQTSGNTSHWPRFYWA